MKKGTLRALLKQGKTLGRWKKKGCTKGTEKYVCQKQTQVQKLSRKNLFSTF